MFVGDLKGTTNHALGGQPILLLFIMSILLIHV